MYNPTFLGDIDLTEDTLAHYGIKGMKWRKRKAKIKADLKWKASKLKNKGLEARAKYLRGKYGYHKTDPTKDVSKFDSHIKRVNGYKDVSSAGLRNLLYFNDWGNARVARAYDGDHRGYSISQTNKFAAKSNLEKGIEAGRERVAAEKKKKKK